MNLPKEFIDSLPLPGSDLEDFVDSLHASSPTSIRINPIKSDFIGEEKRVPWCKTGFYLEERPSFTSDPAFHAGAYYPQEASSMFLEKLVAQIDLPNDSVVLDLCAAPGGKSTLLRTLLPEDALLLCNEIVPKRASILAENLIKWGIPGYAVSNSGPEKFTGLTGIFDLIVVDAPCSGEGLFRKQAEAITEWSPESVQFCADRQKQILEKIWPALKPGGYLIYSTCTFNRLENEENLIWLSQNFDAEFMPLLTTHGIEAVEEEKVRGYRFWPHKIQGEGFFTALIRKADGRPSKTLKKTVHKNFKAANIRQIQDQPLATDLQNNLYLLRESHTKAIELFHSSLKLKLPGHPLGRIIQNKFIPDHGHVTRIRPALSEKVELDLMQSLTYLQCDDIYGEFENEGKVPVSFDDFFLGIGKVHNSRLISNYPRQWKIFHPKPDEYKKIVKPL